MNKTPSILVDTGFEVDQNGILTELDIPSVVSTLSVPNKVVFNGTIMNWMPSTASALREFVAPNITAISTSLLSGYTALTSVTFNGLTSITCPKANNNGAFRGCTSLTAINMPSLTTIEGAATGAQYCGAFYGCTSLESVSLPSLVSCKSYDVNNGEFFNCTGLTSVNFPELQTVGGTLGAVFGNCTGLTTVTLPKIKTIITGASSGRTPFAGCTSLSSVQLGSINNPVSSIGNYTFSSLTQPMTITVYTTGGAALSGSPWGATNATIVYEEA